MKRGTYILNISHERVGSIPLLGELQVVQLRSSLSMSNLYHDDLLVQRHCTPPRNTLFSNIMSQILPPAPSDLAENLRAKCRGRTCVTYRAVAGYMLLCVVTQSHDSDATACVPHFSLRLADCPERYSLLCGVTTVSRLFRRDPLQSGGEHVIPLPRLRFPPCSWTSPDGLNSCTSRPPIGLSMFQMHELSA